MTVLTRRGLSAEVASRFAMGCQPQLEAIFADPNERRSWAAAAVMNAGEGGDLRVLVQFFTDQQRLRDVWECAGFDAMAIAVDLRMIAVHVVATLGRN